MGLEFNEFVDYFEIAKTIKSKLKSGVAALTFINFSNGKKHKQRHTYIPKHASD